MNAGIFIAAMAAGGLGALCRYWVGGAINSRTHFKSKMGTFWVNVSACFLDGLLAGFAAHFLAAWTGMKILKYIVGTGFLGGYSTFSTASVESFENFRKGLFRGFAFTASMFLLSLGVCFAGFFIGLA
ncbi:MAG: CrcB family protein [Aeriscardovia sp.]|nr:CrcB family protein [Aeriscardovia sp.]